MLLVLRCPRSVSFVICLAGSAPVAVLRPAGLSMKGLMWVGSTQAPGLRSLWTVLWRVEVANHQVSVPRIEFASHFQVSGSVV